MSLNRLPGIANPQNTKGLGHFLTTDCKSVEYVFINGILVAIYTHKNKNDPHI